MTKYVLGASTYQFTVGSTTYTVDFKEMTQTNTTTGVIRRIKFDTDKVAMFSEGTLWFPYDKKSSDAIVNAVSGSTVQITIGSQTYNIDTINMTQTNPTSGFTRNVKIV
jgi:hypothetical protein